MRYLYVRARVHKKNIKKIEKEREGKGKENCEFYKLIKFSIPNMIYRFSA